MDIAKREAALAKKSEAPKQKDKQTVFLETVRRGVLTEVQKMVNEKEIDVNGKDAKGRSALVVASKRGHLAIAIILLGAGANINLADDAGNTALMTAALNGQGAVVEMLLAAGADTALTNHYGRTADVLATYMKHTYIKQQLTDADDKRKAAAAAKTNVSSSPSVVSTQTVPSQTTLDNSPATPTILAPAMPPDPASARALTR